MTDLAVIFLTGLTTGGLSCLAVQGGLLASSVAHQAEQNIQKQLAAQSAAKKGKNYIQLKSGPVDTIAAAPQRFAWPILLFLGAKLVAYTILGFLLGAVGSVLQLTPFMRAILQITIGIFMLGTALRMLNIHPIFRYFALEPPAFMTRYIRKTAKNSAHEIITPLFLGALTVFIPCGVTQAMMALAIGAGDAVQGAAIMFAFTLGASPIFFALAYLTTQLGKKLETRFLTLVALVVFVLGLVSINGGLNLLGKPLSRSGITGATSPAINAQSQPPTNPVVTLQPGPQTLIQPTVAPLQPQAQPSLNLPVGPSQPQPPVTGNPAAVDPSTHVVTINALDYGYDPPVIKAPAGQPVQLNLVTNNTYSCTRAFVIPSLNIQQILPESGVTTFDLPAQSAGSVLYFTCSMGMYGGQIQF